MRCDDGSVPGRHHGTVKRRLERAVAGGVRDRNLVGTAGFRYSWPQWSFEYKQVIVIGHDRPSNVSPAAAPTCTGSWPPHVCNALVWRVPIRSCPPPAAHAPLFEAVPLHCSSFQPVHCTPTRAKQQLEFSLYPARSGLAFLNGTTVRRLHLDPRRSLHHLTAIQIPFAAQRDRGPMYPSAGHYPMTTAASFCVHAATRCRSAHPASARSLKALLCCRTFQPAAQPIASFTVSRCNTRVGIRFVLEPIRGARNAFDVTEPWLEGALATLSLTHE